MKDETLCKARDCTNLKGPADSKCGDLCHECWAKKSSSSYQRTIDDPNKTGAGPNFDDPTLEEIEFMKNKIKKENDEKLRPSIDYSREKTIYRYHGEPLDEDISDWIKD